MLKFWIPVCQFLKRLNAHRSCENGCRMSSVHNVCRDICNYCSAFVFICGIVRCRFNFGGWQTLSRTLAFRHAGFQEQGGSRSRLGEYNSKRAKTASQHVNAIVRRQPAENHGENTINATPLAIGTSG